jgi:hypothetical protein
MDSGLDASRRPGMTTFRNRRYGLLRLARNENFAAQLRQTNPTGKSLLIFRNVVKPANQKYSA